MKSLLRSLALLLVLLGSPVFGAGPEIKVSVEKNGGAFVVDADIDFPYPVRTVWEVMTDFDSMAGILSNLKSSRIVRRKETGLVVQQEGTAKYGLFSYTFSSERKIRLEPMKRIVARQISGNARRFESAVELAQTGGGTMVHYHAEMEPDSAIARMFGAPFVQHEVEEQFHAMAGEMEKRLKL